MPNQQNTLKQALRLCRASFVSVGVFSGIANLLMLVPAFFMLNVYDKAVGQNSLATLWVLSGITVFMFLVLGVMEVLRSRVLVAVSTRLDQLIGPSLYETTFRSAVLVGGHRAGLQPLSDLAGLRQFLTGQPIFAFFDAPWLPVYLLILFMFHPLLGWMGVVAAIVFLILALLNQKRVAPPLDRANQLSRSNMMATQANLRNAEVVAAMGMGEELEQRWRRNQDLLLASQEEASHSAGAFNAVTKTLRLAVQSAAIGAGAYLVLIQEISPGMIIAGSILIGRALQPVEMAVGAWRSFLEAKDQFQRLDVILDASSGKEEKMRLPPIKGALKAQGLAITPPGAKIPTISGINIDLPAGSVCMVLGPSGSGKSTFIKALLGLWPAASGEIRLDGVAPILFDRSELGPQIGYLPQDIELLEGSISSNIARFGELDPDAVVAAATEAGVHEFILSLPNGYDTEIGKPGGELSPGQRQRIALARALYMRPRLIVLDEPNSNLDESGDRALFEAIASMKNVGATVIIVTHRTTILPLADYLLVLAERTQQSFGPAEAVLASLQGKTEEVRQTNRALPKQDKPPASFRAVSWGSGDTDSSE